MKEGSSLATMVSRRSPTDSPNLAGSKSHALGAKSSAVAIHANAADDSTVVRVKAQVMTRSDEGWVAVDGGGLSLVGVYRRCVHVPIAPTPASQSRTRSAKDKESDCSSRREKSSHKELSDEPDSAIECSAADDDKPVDGTCKVQCYECTEFCIRAQRITDGHVTLSYVMNKDLAYHQPQPLFHHWRCVCEACKCGATTATSTVTATQQRSLLSNQSSTNSSLCGWPVRASNNYVNLPTGKHRLAKNASVDSSNVNAPSSFTGSSSSGFGSNALQQLQQQTAALAFAHNHGSFGLTFESSTDARAFHSAVRSALDKLESEAKADAVNITLYPIPLLLANTGAGTALPSAYAPKVNVNSQISTCNSASAVRSQPSSTCDSQTAAATRMSAALGRKQSSPNVLDASPSCAEHPPLAKTYSDPPASTYTLPAENGASNGQAEAGPVKQLTDTVGLKSHVTSADDYSCLWDLSARVRHPATLNAAPVQCTRPAGADRRFVKGVTSFEFDAIVHTDNGSSRRTNDAGGCIRPTHYSTSICDDTTRRFRGSPPVEPATPYSRLAECDIGLRHLDAGTKRSSSLGRLNHFGVRPTYFGMSNTNTNVQIASDVNRPSPSPSPFPPASASKHGTLSMRAHEANQNLYTRSSYPHLAPNATQLHANGACSRSSPSNAHACVGTSTGTGTVKTESGSPRFLKLFRSKKRGSRCDTVSLSSASGVSQSLLSNMQAQEPAVSSSARRSSKNSASRRSTTTRPPLTRARCLHCQQQYFVERNQRGACSEAPSKAQHCGRSNRYFSLVDSCMHSLLESDNSDTDFEDERLRSSHSHSSTRSSGAHEHEDSGISTFSTSASHNRRQHGVASSHLDEYDVDGDEHDSHSHCCAAPHCRRRRPWARRLLVGLLSIVAPCVWCYWVLVCYSCAATSCCARCVGARHEPMPAGVAVDPNAPDHKS